MEILACRVCLWCVSQDAPCCEVQGVLGKSPMPLSSGPLNSPLGATCLPQLTLEQTLAKQLWLHIYVGDSVLEESIFLTELHSGPNLSNWESGNLSLFNHWKKYLSKR